MDEFGLIARHFAPLAGDGARGLKDDVAFWSGLAVTKDLIVEGTHFLPEDPLDSVARKAVGVNASDLLSKGCRPLAMLLGLVFPSAAGEEAFARFAEGLSFALSEHELVLLGGDTTRHAGRGPMTVSVTMLGKALRDEPVGRDGAGPGDVVMVTGTIGDAGLGLHHLTGRWDAGRFTERLVRAYRLPAPSSPRADLVARFATASLDVSDGLVADARHLGTASGLRVRLDASAVPLSPAGKAFVEAEGALGLIDLVTAGDDYQTLLAIPSDRAEDAVRAADAEGLDLTPIGVCEAGEPGAVLTGEDGEPLDVGEAGFTHF